MLSSEQLAQFQRDGYLAVQDFFNPAQLKKRVDGLLEEYVPTEHTETRFTSDDDNHVGNDYFLSSGDQIRYFLEPGASVDTDPSKTINKIGHGLHYKDKLFRAFTTQPKLAEVARQLGFRAPHILQSMVICKQPGIGAPVPAHVDSTFLYTDPPSAIGFWYVHTNMLTIRFALEDATLENGCMHFCPGSHTLPLRKRFVRDKKSKEGTCMRYINEGVREPLDSEYVPTPTPAGTLVLIHGSVYHKSTANTSNKSRFIYTFHVVEGEAVYDEENWLQVPPRFVYQFV